MDKRRVHIINGNYQYSRMFVSNGWELVDTIDDADLVQFTGGEDVTPEYYGEVRHPTTGSNSFRDSEEAVDFRTCLRLGKPMAGICRGGQFLNVMSGGRMYQHVDRHAIGGTHVAVDTRTGVMYPVTSTHHQMMRPGVKGEVLGVASESTFYEHMGDGGIVRVHPDRGEDVEAVYYRHTNSLCYQPHPEYLQKGSPCQEWYFSLIEEKLMQGREVCAA